MGTLVGYGANCGVPERRSAGVMTWRENAVPQPRVWQQTGRAPNKPLNKRHGLKRVTTPCLGLRRPGIKELIRESSSRRICGYQTQSTSVLSHKTGTLKASRKWLGRRPSSRRYSPCPPMVNRRDPDVLRKRGPRAFENQRSREWSVPQSTSVEADAETM